MSMPTAGSPTIYTTLPKWNTLTDAERLDRVQSAQRLSSALGPDERHMTSAVEWESLSEAQKRSLLFKEEVTVADRAAKNRRAQCTCAA